MKINVCDVCLKEGAGFKRARTYWRMKSRIHGTIRIDVCKKHRDWGKSNKYEDAEKLLMKIYKEDKC